MHPDVLLLHLGRGLLRKKDVEDARLLQDKTGQTLEKILLDKGLVSEDQNLRGYAEVFGLDYIPQFGRQRMPEAFVAKVPAAFCRMHGVCGVDVRDGVFRVACSNPIELTAVDEVARRLNAEVELVLAPRDEIISLINRSYASDSEVVDEMLEGLDEKEFGNIANEVELTEDLLDVANKAPIIKLVNMILFNAIKLRASDVHIQPYEEKIQIRYRIDGVLYDMASPPKKLQDAIISRIKVMGRMDIAERRVPQDGGASIRVGNKDVDLRISTVPTFYGERVVFRIQDKSSNVYQLDRIGLSPLMHAQLSKFVEYEHGIILVTGPTGSGKTTTLYSCLSKINDTENNIITIEDPVEYQLRGISQIEVANKKGLTFATGLRSILRQDPDIIMVGEIRDRETANIAIESALTGHLVLSTVHTNDAAGAVTRLIELGVEPFLVASSVLCIAAQRLVRVICPSCRVAVDPDPAVLKAVGASLKDIPGGKLYQGTGCGDCMNTGYMGRTGIYELFPMTDSVRELVMQRASSAQIKRMAIERSGMRTLRQDGVDKALQGVTTIEEVLKKTQIDEM
ncbi:MAG: type II secretion system ATPase GspE [Planctomycetota bacterium]